MTNQEQSTPQATGWLERFGEWLVHGLLAWLFVPAVLVDAEEEEHIRKHALVVGSGGAPIKILPRAKRGLRRWFPVSHLRETQRHMDDREYQEYLDRMMSHLTRTRPDKGVLVIIHGGNQSPRNTIRNCVTLYERISGDGYYPIFINWDSNLRRAYSQQLLRIRSGLYQPRLAAASAPFYLAADLTRGATHLLPMLYQYFWLLWRSSRWYQYETLENLDQLTAPAVISQPWTPGLSMPRLAQIIVSSLVQPLPLLIVGAGVPRAWENLLRRSRAMFRASREFDPTAFPGTGLPPGVTFQPCMGAMALFLDALDDTVTRGAGMKVTFIAHSMGSMIANEALQYKRSLPVASIVYLAPACSVRDFAAAVGPIVAREEGAEAYVLTLHPRVEAGQRDFGGLTGGSVLEWLEGSLATPHTYLDRTLGKWENALRTCHIYEPAVRRHIHIKSLPYDGSRPQKPYKHVHFDDPDVKYWEPSFWWK